MHAGPLPPHGIVFNAVGDADSAGPALAQVAALLADERGPVLNPPAAVAQTGRLANAERLRGIPGVRTARTMLLPRAALVAPDGAALLKQSAEALKNYSTYQYTEVTSGGFPGGMAHHE